MIQKRVKTVVSNNVVMMECYDFCIKNHTWYDSNKSILLSQVEKCTKDWHLMCDCDESYVQI